MSFNSVGPAEFGVSPTTGFLPETDPLQRLSAPFEDWEDFAHALPKMLMSSDLRRLIRDLPPFPSAQLKTSRQLERAMVMLSFIGHAYAWGGEKPASVLPANLAGPWHTVARKLGRPPVLSYASYCLHNWQRLDRDQLPALGNISLIQNFLGGEDEEWFVLIHVEIERRAAAGMAVVLALQESANRKDKEETGGHLTSVYHSLKGMNEVMNRMEERCYPFCYFHRVRPFIHGWRNHPDLPEGVIYDGVVEYGGRPQTFRGETGAQSAIVPALDAALELDHAPDELRDYLNEMRQYMPPKHDQFIRALEAKKLLRSFVSADGKELGDIYNACVHELEQFRSTHLMFAAKYIHQQAQTDPKNPSQVGTGGTPFMKYLKKHRDETAEQRLVS